MKIALWKPLTNSFSLNEDQAVFVHDYIEVRFAKTKPMYMCWCQDAWNCEINPPRWICRIDRFYVGWAVGMVAGFVSGMLW
jgi:hypothetical protein